MVDTKLINIGEVYTYKRLCELFNESRTSSNSKKAQLKRWRCYFEWTNPTKQTYLITDIFDTPRELEDGRKNNGGNCTSKYREFDDIIMEYILHLHQNSTNQNRTIKGTIGRILTNIGIFSQKYLDNRREHNDYINTTLSEGVVNNVFWRTQEVIDMAKGALKRLEKSGNISITKIAVLVAPLNRYIELSPKGTKRVECIRDEVLSELNMKINDLYNKNKREAFNKRMSEILTEEFGEKINYTYMEYEIKLLSDDYKNKTNLTIYDLTRKFVWSTCQSIYKLKYDKREGFYQEEKTMCQVIVLLTEIFPYMISKNWEKLIQEPEVKEFGEGILVRAYKAPELSEIRNYQKIWGKKKEFVNPDEWLL